MGLTSNKQIFMKYLKSKQQLDDLLNSGKTIIIIFVDPHEFMPSKLLLNYIYSHTITPHVDTLLFIWNLVDQQIYNKYQVISFPQLTVLKAKEALFSFIGYNREKANEAMEVLCRQSGLGKLTKQINKALSRCPNGHEMVLLCQKRESMYVGGCFECNRCNRLCHFQKSKPTLHCEYCTYDLCTACSWIEVLI